MKNQEFKDKSGRVIAKVKEINRKMELRTLSNVLLGRFDPKSNETRDPSNKLIGKGNLLATLL